jgi:hypothetical protein
MSQQEKGQDRELSFKKQNKHYEKKNKNDIFGLSIALLTRYKRH